MAIATKKINNEHKQHLLNAGGQRVKNQNDHLHDAIMIGSEAEIEAKDIKLNLEGQGNQLEGTRNNIYRINRNLTAGSRLIDAMKRHETKNKMILI